MEFPININILGFNSSEGSFFYDGNTGVLSETTPLMLKVLELCSHKNKAEIYEILRGDYSESDIRLQIEEIEKYINKGMFIPKFDIVKIKYPSFTKEEWFEGKALTNIWLNVAHDCNLRCKYCFGAGGSYGHKRGVMTIDTAKKCIDYWYKYLNKSLKKVNVTFFGGEPFMNPEVLFFATEYINSLFEKDKVLVVYSVTTNGTILNQKFLTWLTDNKIYPLISIDGGPEIQDENRPYETGKGSYKIIERHVKQLKDIIPELRARMTLTKKNIPTLEKSVNDLWEMGFNHIGYEIVAIEDPAMSISADDLNILFPIVKKLTDVTCDNLINNRNYTLSNIVKPSVILHNNIQNASCSLYGTGTLIFDPDGNMHKCHRLVDDEDFKVGNINTGIEWDTYGNKYIKRDIPKCKKCWAKPLCQDGCAHINKLHNNDIFSPYDLWCAHTQFLIKESFLLYTKLYKECPDIFNKYFKKAKEKL